MIQYINIEQNASLWTTLIQYYKNVERLGSMAMFSITHNKEYLYITPNGFTIHG